MKHSRGIEHASGIEMFLCCMKHIPITVVERDERELPIAHCRSVVMSPNSGISKKLGKGSLGGHSVLSLMNV